MRAAFDHIADLQREIAAPPELRRQSTGARAALVAALIEALA